MPKTPRSGPPSPEDRARLRAQRTELKLAQRKADLKETKVKIFPRPRKIGLGDFNTFSVKRGLGPETVGSFEYVKPRVFQDDIGYIHEAPGKIIIDYIAPKGIRKGLAETHKKVAGKMLNREVIKESLKELKKRYPKAEKVVGTRMTGAHARFGGPLQKFKLPELKTTVEKIGRFARKASRKL